MKTGWRWLRSLIFVLQIYLAMGVLGLLFAPWAAVSARGARKACKLYCRWVLWTARWMVGLRHEVRGTPPKGEVMIAAKHQSFLDILIIFNSVPAAKFIMKRELLWAPVIGIYAYRIGCVPVDRGQRGQAIRKMLADVDAGRQQPGQLVIYSQGTRVAPGVRMPYKAGTGVLYQQLGQSCVPAATNVGVFWPRKGIMRKPGLAVVEFLEPIPPGLPRDEMMKTLEERVESTSDRLMKEAGFDPDAA
ncbi:MAG: lysophospholipid acyltransferase family protein [Sediminimonas sp.]|uniref:1-acyl-sn-glycerol-3-phosphate acyltransferase n=1 Tax=Sediminimonas qiaohouensis TaxID=552061 RepID=A0A7C9HA20_9RHOB|nr:MULTISPECIES: lysophospholipid acyltransferase family protein [Sediminimonas]MDR9483804.1 lysophospholipid acyltransferase family protein [Sediminimonas sp.]MTJ03891.1 1-acyl-sn-glycerol-3-phosphate acyltransferase [Sediminimonas qiaohouensis]